MCPYLEENLPRIYPLVVFVLSCAVILSLTLLSSFAFSNPRACHDQVESVVVETWGESQVAMGDTVTATVTVVREHAPEYQGFRRRCAASPPPTKDKKTHHLCFSPFRYTRFSCSARVGVRVFCQAVYRCAKLLQYHTCVLPAPLARLF